MIQTKEIKRVVRAPSNRVSLQSYQRRWPGGGGGGGSRGRGGSEGWKRAAETREMEKEDRCEGAGE